jgi:hypothetical protein
LYGRRTVVQLFHSLLVSSVSVGFFDVGCIPPVYVHLVCVDRSLFLVNTVAGAIQDFQLGGRT